MYSVYRIIVGGFALLLISIIEVRAQNTYYYKQVRVEKGGSTIAQGKGGQFISFYKDICYDSDNKGVSVNNGQMERTTQSEGGYLMYKGSSYWGKVNYYFSSSLDKLVVSKSDGTTYLYQRATAPSGVTTCSLIKSKSSGGSSSGYMPSTYYNPPTNYGGGASTSTYPSGSNSTYKEQKTRKPCPRCNGSGEEIIDPNPPRFGTAYDNGQTYCSKCGRYFRNGSHAHVSCKQCYGKKYIEY